MTVKMGEMTEFPKGSNGRPSDPPLPESVVLAAAVLEGKILSVKGEEKEVGKIVRQARAIVTDAGGVFKTRTQKDGSTVVGLGAKK